MNILNHAWIALLTLIPLAHAQDGDWPGFRGPGGLSVADDTPIATTFGPDSKVLWKTVLPAGHSSPCIVAQRIFVTGAEGSVNVILGLDRKDGKVLWTKRFEGTEHPAYFHVDSSAAGPTPVCDGERVIAYFGNYGLVALDLQGELLWEKRLPHPGYVFGVGCSPLLYDGLLILQRDGAPEAGVLALDASDGSELWRIDRFGFAESHGTPFLWRNAERSELVISGNNTLHSYHPGTGEQLWTLGGLTAFPCTTPTADEETLYFAAWSTPNATGRSFWEAAFARSLDLSDAEIADPGLLFKRLDGDADGKVLPGEVPECRAKDAFGFLDRNANGAWEVEELLAVNTPSGAKGENLMVAIARGGQGELAPTLVRWNWKRGLPYVSSPLLYRGRIWLLQSGGLVTVLDAKSGKALIDRERLSDRAEYYLSPVGAAGHVLAGSAEGTLYVLAADKDELVVEHSVSFDEGLCASPAVLDGIVYLRTSATLWAFGDRP